MLVTHVYSVKSFRIGSMNVVFKNTFSMMLGLTTAEMGRVRLGAWE